MQRLNHSAAHGAHQVHIAFVEIQNFRKLKACRVQISQQETIFVGVNNSGKTIALDALILIFMRNHGRDLSTTDFTLSKWSGTIHLGVQLGGFHSPQRSRTHR